MRKLTMMALPAALLAASPALAGGLDPAPAEPIVVTQAQPVFAGTDWTGFYVGGQIGYGQVDTSIGIEGDGILGGVHLGYMWDFGSTVIGAELDYDTAELELDAGAGTIDDVTRLKLRAGYDLGNGALLYGTLGMAQAGATLGGIDRDDTGWLAGAGAAFDLGGGWVAGGELLYHQFDDYDSTGIDVDVTTLTARVSYRF